MTEISNYYKQLKTYEQYLNQEEKSEATTEKYMRDIRAFLSFLNGRTITKEETLSYKQQLSAEYAPASANSMLVALNGFLRFIGMSDCTVKPMKIQRQIFCQEEKELSKAEYKRLLAAANDTRLSYVIQTICGTGIRVSELKYITVVNCSKGLGCVSCA